MLPWDCRKMEGCAQCTAMQLPLIASQPETMFTVSNSVDPLGVPMQYSDVFGSQAFSNKPYANVTDVLSSFVTIESQKFRSGNATFCAVTHHLNKRREERDLHARASSSEWRKGAFIQALVQCNIRNGKGGVHAPCRRPNQPPTRLRQPEKYWM